jgi:2-Cys peroxiredoxin 5
MAASLVSSAAQTAHSIATSILARAQIQPGQTIPSAEVKENSPEKTENLVLSGKNVLVCLVFS